MKINELMQETFSGPSGLTWRYRQPGVMLSNEVSTMLSGSVSSQALARMLSDKKSADGQEKKTDIDAGSVDIERAMRLHAQAVMLAFRVCVLAVDGLKDENDAPIDLAQHRTESVSVSGVNTKAISSTMMEVLDAGIVAADIRELGSMLVNLCKMSMSQKKT